MRHWLLTSTFYGNWLPGDERGFVGSVRDLRPGEDDSTIRLEHDLPGDPYDARMPGLHRASAALMKGPPISIELPHAKALLKQFLETATRRQWRPLAIAIMRDHIHLVVQVPDDPDPDRLLGDFKSYGSRALNEEFGRPPSATWWTSGGSQRKLKDAAAVAAAIRYVLLKQPHPLIVWSPTT